VIGAGTYAARAVPINDDKDGEVGCRFGESEKKGTPFVQVLCQIIRGPLAGRTIMWTSYFSGGATEHTIKALRAFGFDGDELAAFVTQRPENEVSIVVQMEEGNNGRSYPKIAWVNAPNRGFKIEKPIAGADLRKFSASFKNSLKTAPVVKGTKAVLEAPSGVEDPGSVTAGPPDDGGGDPGPGMGDDGIPF
jgi:hypothetical protein